MRFVFVAGGLAPASFFAPGICRNRKVEAAPGQNFAITNEITTQTKPPKMLDAHLLARVLQSPLLGS
jgi:hypothetical protein